LKTIKTTDEFKALVEKIKAQPHYKDPIGFGIARVDMGQKNEDQVLQANFPLINWNENFGSAAIFMAALEASGETVATNESESVHSIDFNFINYALASFAPYVGEAFGDVHKNVQVIKTLQNLAIEAGIREGEYKVVFLFEDTKPCSVEAVYLKLYALSQAKVPLRGICLDGAFGVLPNVAWSGSTPIELEWLRENEIELKLSGSYPDITSVDKFPRFLQHIIPQDNTRILEASKVRMGAQLAAGTTVMPGASYINFNAGTTGAVMVEGRISSSAIVGKGSDVGGGASILGVLSGTNGNPVSIGENTLLGANSVCGIPLGDGCIIDAGLSILEGTKVHINEAAVKMIQAVNSGLVISEDGYYKGLTLAGMNGIHFRFDTIQNRLVATRSKREIVLNDELH
jgi:2,3,4,5-tetrahydropyridine-2-carboxylate N-succinyltransferase